MTTISISVEAARTLLMLGAIHGTGRNERIAVNELTKALRGVSGGGTAEPKWRPTKEVKAARAKALADAKAAEQDEAKRKALGV